MSYSDTYAILVNGANEVFANMFQAPGDVTACPPTVTCISRSALTYQYERRAAALSITPAEVTEQILFDYFGYTDARV